jgi:putative addiction module killer protein
MLEIRYYVAAGGHQPFAEWFADLDPIARAKVARAITRMEQGNLSNVKSVGEGVLEYKIDFGPGYRVYFGRDIGDPADRRHEEATAARHRSGCCLLAGLQARQARFALNGDER